jgi:hypothetical protein
MTILQQTVRSTALFQVTNPACGQTEENHNKFQELPNTKGLSSINHIARSTQIC